MWIYPNSVSAGYKCFARKNYAYEFDCGIDNTELKMHHGDGAFEVRTSSGAGLVANKWQYAVITRITIPKQVKFYVNG